MYAGYRLESLKKRDPLEELGIDKRKIKLV